MIKENNSQQLFISMAGDWRLELGLGVFTFFSVGNILYKHYCTGVKYNPCFPVIKLVGCMHFMRATRQLLLRLVGLFLPFQSSLQAAVAGWGFHIIVMAVSLATRVVPRPTNDHGPHKA